MVEASMPVRSQEATYVPALYVEKKVPAVPPPPVPVGLPSLGSAYHHLGLCRACDFTYRGGGCREGADCKFCHLCGPDVSRRRKKERKMFVAALRLREASELGHAS